MKHARTINFLLVLGLLATGSTACSAEQSMNNSPSRHAGHNASTAVETETAWVLPMGTSFETRTRERIPGDDNYLILTAWNEEENVARVVVNEYGTAERMPKGDNWVTAAQGDVLHFIDITYDAHGFEPVLKVDNEVVEVQDFRTSGILVVSAPEDAEITLEVFTPSTDMPTESPYWPSSGLRHDYRQAIDLKTGTRLTANPEVWYHSREAEIAAHKVVDDDLNNNVLAVYRRDVSTYTGPTEKGEAIIQLVTEVTPDLGMGDDVKVRVPILTDEEGQTYSPIHFGVNENHGAVYLFKAPENQHHWTFHYETFNGLPEYVERPVMVSSKAVFNFERVKL